MYKKLKKENADIYNECITRAHFKFINNEQNDGAELEISFVELACKCLGIL